MTRIFCRYQLIHQMSMRLRTWALHDKKHSSCGQNKTYQPLGDLNVFADIIYSGKLRPRIFLQILGSYQVIHLMSMRPRARALHNKKLIMPPKQTDQPLGVFNVFADINYYRKLMPRICRRYQVIHLMSMRLRPLGLYNRKIDPVAKTTENSNRLSTRHLKCI